MPRATELLPHSSATATTSATLEDILPTVNRDARLTVFIDGDNEMEHNQHRVNNDSLVDLRNKNNSIGSIGSHISDQDNTTHSLDSLQEDNDDAQSQDSDMDTVHRTGQKDADNSSSTSDDESYDCSRQCIDDCDDDVSGIWVWTESWSRFRFNPRRRCTDGPNFWGSKCTKCTSIPVFRSSTESS
ncbi:hypothetical protein B0H14DRAFT_1331282 [Mycena olivaceomarginata]|nr:hypothetical protein B0H14DRAFT_1331282 [Mycena olivaceomarginata]